MNRGMMLLLVLNLLAFGWIWRGFMRLDAEGERLEKMERESGRVPPSSRALPPSVVSRSSDELGPLEERLGRLERRLAPTAGEGSGIPAAPGSVRVPPRAELAALIGEEYLAARRRRIEGTPEPSREEMNREANVTFVRELLGLTQDQALDLVTKLDAIDTGAHQIAGPFIDDYNKWGKLDVEGLVRKLDYEYERGMKEAMQKLTPEQTSRFQEIQEVFGQERRSFDLADGKTLRVIRNIDRHSVEILDESSPH